MGCEALKARSRRENALALHDPQNAARRPIGKTAMYRVRAAESCIGKKVVPCSVVKKAHAGKGHNHTVCIACAYDVVVAY